MDRARFELASASQEMRHDSPCSLTPSAPSNPCPRYNLNGPVGSTPRKDMDTGTVAESCSPARHPSSLALLCRERACRGVGLASTAPRAPIQSQIYPLFL